MTTSGTIDTSDTVLDLITEALSELGAVDIKRGPTGAQAAQCVRRLRWMLKAWQADGCPVWREESVEITIAANTAETELETRVIDVQEARLVVTATYERPLARFETSEYRSLPNKATVGQPTCFSLKTTRDAVSVLFWPVPSTTMTVNATVARVIEDVTETTQTLDVPQEWARCIVFGLAREMAGPVGASESDKARVTAEAERAYASVRDMGRSASVFFGR